MINSYGVWSGALSLLLHVLVIGFLIYIRVQPSAVPVIMANAVFLVREAKIVQPAVAVVHPIPSPARVPLPIMDMRQIVLRHLQRSPDHHPEHIMQSSIQRDKSVPQLEKNQKGLRDRAVLLQQYQQMLIAHVRRFVLIPFDVPSHNPVVFDVTQSHDGHIVSVRLRHSSGNVAYDRAVERAIGLANPLPIPTEARFFEAHLVLRFYPS